MTALEAARSAYANVTKMIAAGEVTRIEALVAMEDCGKAMARVLDNDSDVLVGFRMAYKRLRKEHGEALLAANRGRLSEIFTGVTFTPRPNGTIVVAEEFDDETLMAIAEAEADRAQTIRDETNKHFARRAMERVPFGFTADGRRGHYPWA